MATENWFEGIEGFEALEGGAGMFGIAAGIGAALLAPVVVPLLGQAGKPVMKRVLKEGILFYERGKEAMAEMSDAWEDLMAEARYEAAQAQQTTDNGSTQPQSIPVED